jgi:hypothetical protein
VLHQVGLERPNKEKHSSLLRTFLNYGSKKFYNIGPSGLRSLHGGKGRKEISLSLTLTSIQVKIMIGNIHYEIEEI